MSPTVEFLTVTEISMAPSFLEEGAFLLEKYINWADLELPPLAT
jgi:hypothetical protein